MTWLLVFGGTVFTAFALYLTVAPFLGGRREATRVEHLDEEIREIELLSARREVLLSALRELEFEHETNKIDTEDFETFRKRYEREAVRILRRLDELHGGRGWEARIDRELEERLGRPSRLAAEEAAERAGAANEHEDEPADEAATEPVNEAEEETQEEAVETAAPTNGRDLVTDEEDAPVDEPEDEPDLGCLTCGEPLDLEDRFCSQCGTPVELPEPDDAQTREANA